MGELCTWTEAELLATGDVTEPLVIGGMRCHGGFDSGGRYVSPRTRFRCPAVEAWQERHRADFGTEVLAVPLETWPEPYPNVAQTKYLLREGVREPVITTLTRIGTVEGFGAMIRYVGAGDPQRFFAESVAGTATAHLERGLFEAHARDEAGWEAVAGHKDMWFAVRDLAFERPVTEDETALMLERMGLTAGGGPPSRDQLREAALALRVHDDIDLGLEMLIRRMIAILLIEISAFHVFAWAEEVLSDTDLVAAEGEAARIVSYIRQDEAPHVEYLKMALTEMRDHSFVGESGRRHLGTEIVGRLWDLGLEESLGVRREAMLRTTLAEVKHALAGHRRHDEILEGFHACGSLRPGPHGVLVTALDG